MNKLLIIGDSFSADSGPESWTSMIDNYQITNLSSKGASQYRLFKKLKNTNLLKFDAIAMVHTSPNRIYIEHNPFHKNNQGYEQCDLIYSDIKNRIPNSYAEKVSWWFENVFDLNQALDIHQLLVKSCQDITSQIANLHLTFFDLDMSDVFNLNNIWKTNVGNINHLSKNGNLEVAHLINKLLK